MAHPDQEEAWKLAFGAAVLELQVEDVTVRDIYTALWSNRGSARKQKSALLTCLGNKPWKWNLYEGNGGAPDYESMAEALVTHVEATAHALFRRGQLIALRQVRPYWQFRALAYISPPECQQLDGTILHCEDSFWSAHFPPCGRVPCRCYIEALNERDVAKKRPQ